MVIHHPPHLFLDETWYIITAATHERRRLIAGDGTKTLFRSALRTLVSRFHFSLLAWVILDDHYHLILKTASGKVLPDFMRQLHGRTAHDFNVRDAVVRRQVWHNFWDTCVRTEADLWTRFDYVHFNPVKHGYVSQPDDWAFSSYQFYRQKKGLAWLQDCWARYPVIDTLSGDDFG